MWNNGEIEKLSRKFHRHNQRVFTVGVGSAVSEKLVNSLAKNTQGVSEFVAPNEEMVDKVHRHFQRIFLPALTDITLDWGQDVIWQSPLNYLYLGDSVTLYAQLKDKPSTNTLMIRAGVDGHNVYQQSIDIEYNNNPSQAILRQVVNEQLRFIEDDAIKADLAVNYQLMDETTAFIMVQENEVKENTELPVFRKVTQMLAAGYAGYGTVVKEASTGYLDVPAFLRRTDPSPSPSNLLFSMNRRFSRKEESETNNDLAEFIKRFKKSYKKNKLELTKITINQLVDLGLPDDTAEDLADVIRSMTTDEHAVLLYFIAELAQRYLMVTSVFRYAVTKKAEAVNLPEVIKVNIIEVIELHVATQSRADSCPF